MKDCGIGTVASRIDRLVYTPQEPLLERRHQHQQRRRSKSQSRAVTSTSSTCVTTTSSGFRTFDTNQLQSAVFRGCIECIKGLVETPPYLSVNGACGPEGLRPIHIAAREGHLPVLRFLSSIGGCLEKCDAHGSTGLHHAAWGGQLRATRWLLRHGAQITLDKRGKTPVHVASDLGHTEIVTLLTNHSSSYGRTPSSECLEDNNNNSITPSSATTISSHSNNHKRTKSKERKLNREKVGEFYRESDPQQGQSVQDLSSSGNFSLGTTTGTSSGSNSPLSPPSPVATPCGCSKDESQVTGGSTNTTIGHAPSRIQSSEPPTVTSFYLHPPRSSSRVVSPSPNERSPGQRKQVTVSVALEPFFLHPPSGINSESSSSNTGKSNSVHLHPDTEMSPVTPVTSGADMMPSMDPPNEEKSDGSSTPPSPPTPPPKIGRVQALKSAIANENQTTPPPPPPMPKLPEKPKSPGSGPQFGFFPTPIRNGNSNQENCAGNSKGVDDENEYEDIEEIGQGEPHYEEANGIGNRKLNRSVSVPYPGNQNMTEAKESSPLIQPKALPGMRRPFIPPNFPDPPKDALIKPSEYLKSLQQSPNNGKYGKVGTAAPPSPGRTPVRSRVEDAIRVLNGTEMPSVPEETSSEEQPQEGYHEQRSSGHVTPTNGDGKSGNIMAEALMRVNLRKTPMARTLSAPALGRVLPDVNPAPPPEEKRPSPTHSQVLSGKSSKGATPAAIIAELAQSSSVGGVREWKEELRRRQLEEDKAAAKEIASIYSPLKFVAEMPELDENGTPIPEWKRQMMAKKAAEKAKREAEEQRKLEAEAKRASAIPPWKRQLMQRRDADGKGAQ